MALSTTWDPKDPDEVVDYDVDWTERIDDGDSIVASEWLIASGGVALVIDSDSFTTTRTEVWLSGGTLNTTYQLTNRVTTQQGRVMDQTMKLKVKTK